MDNNNPAEMSNDDLEKDMDRINAESNLSGNQEKVTAGTAAEGTLKTPDEDISTAIGKHTAYHDDAEQDLDDLVHQRAKEANSQDGSLPDPEALKNWAGDDTFNEL